MVIFNHKRTWMIILVTNVFGILKDVGFVDLFKIIKWLPNNTCWPLVINLVDFLTTFAHKNIEIKKKHSNIFFPCHWIYKHKDQNSCGCDGHWSWKFDTKKWWCFMDAINECLPNLPPILIITQLWIQRWKQ
jgi:hypothetical protein